MTTKFPNKESALITGIYYAGRNGQIVVEDLKRLPDREISIGFVSPETIELYEIESSRGKTLHLGVEKFQGDRYCLWLIDPKTGLAQRV